MVEGYKYSKSACIGEQIKIENIDLSSLNIGVCNGRYFITESSLHKLSKDNDIIDIEKIKNQILKHYNLSSLEVFSKTKLNESIGPIYSMVLLLEELNPNEVISAADGISFASRSIDRVHALVSKSIKHDELQVETLRKHIAKCDKVLKDIKDEQAKLQSSSRIENKTKFTLAFFIRSFKSLCMELLAIHIGGALAAGWIEAINWTAGVAYNGDIFNHLVNIGITFADYKKLLMHYEIKVKAIKKDYEIQLKELESGKKKEGKKMENLKEDDQLFSNNDEVEVYYQAPEEFDIDDHPAVLHDGDDLSDADDVIAMPKELSSDPHSVEITKYGGKYYISHSDLRCYMDTCKNMSYEQAIDSIINSYDIPEMCSESVRIIIGRQNLKKLDPKVRQILEDSKDIWVEVKDTEDLFDDFDDSNDVFDTDDTFDDL